MKNTNPDPLHLAYAAGVVDSDGCITLTRGRSRGRRLYAPKLFVRQVERPAIDFLHPLFGGYTWTCKPSLPGGRPIHEWHTTHATAVRVAILLEPYLRIKRRQAQLLIEFQATIENQALKRPSHWFTWVTNEPTVSPGDLARRLGIAPHHVYQAINTGSLPSRKTDGHVEIPERAAGTYKQGGGRRKLPTQYTSLCEDFCQAIQSLNGPTRGVKSKDRKPQ